MQLKCCCHVGARVGAAVTRKRRVSRASHGSGLSTYQPLITLPMPIMKVSSFFLSRLLSNTVPSSKVPT